MNETSYGIDSHKLIYHVGRVDKWLKGGNVYPIYIEAAPAGHCNQRCIFCGLDYVDRAPKLISLACWNRFIKEAGRKGLKSVLFSGEGEPLLNKDISEMVRNTKASGVDAAIASNGTLLTPEISKSCLRHLTWLRISLDAGSPKVYSRIHQVNAKQFDLVVSNVKKAVEIKRKNNYAVTIGVQFLLLKENLKDIGKALDIARRIGVDYFSVKPYSKHPLSVNEAGTQVDYSKLIRLKDSLSSYNTERLKVIVRIGAMKRKLIKKPYGRCLGLPFWAYIDSLGDVYPCSTFLKIKRYCLGNICKEGFGSIWEGKKRREVMARFEKMDATRCRELCRLDEINIYLWKLKHPPAHVNYI
jgi:GTP 3',8-cyclase